jgi:hypothetical protein
MREEVNIAGVVVGNAAAGNAAMRRSGRVSRQVAILLIGSDTEGTVFCEETHTVVLSRHGAGVVSRQRLVAEQELVLRIFGTDREAEIRVVGEIAKEGDVHTYGVASVDERLDFWGVDFPEAPVWEGRPEVLTLECGSCKELVELRNADFEYDICVIHGGLPRFCEECGFLTVWRRANEAWPGGSKGVRGNKRRKGEENASELMPLGKLGKQSKSENGKWKMGNREEEERLNAETQSTPRNRGEENPRPTFTQRRWGTHEQMSAFRGAKITEEAVILPVAVVPVESKERRERVRAKVNFFACVRTETFGDDVVRCIDMSKGGVSFKSEHGYEKNARIEIAVPFAAEVIEAPAIFVRGRIANVAEMGRGCGGVGWSLSDEKTENGKWKIESREPQIQRQEQRKTQCRGAECVEARREEKPRTEDQAIEHGADMGASPSKFRVNSAGTLRVVRW